MNSKRPSLVVFSPSPVLTVTVEDGSAGSDEIHLHAGGQGFWVARMAAVLGADVRLCAPFGGEVGEVLMSLTAQEDVAVSATRTAQSSGAYVHDRRSGGREELATMRPSPMSRHEADDLYTRFLAAAMASDIAVLAGPDRSDALDAETYGRLTADLASLQVPVVADLSGDPLRAALSGGRLRALKASSADLVRDGWMESDDEGTTRRVIEQMAPQADCVTVTRAAKPAIGWTEKGFVRVVGPDLAEVDHRGAGDAMAAGMAVALARGEDSLDAVRLGSAAGTLNVTRRGLATGRRDAIELLATRITIEELS